jgi:hypothetical protein
MLARIFHSCERFFSRRGLKAKNRTTRVRFETEHGSSEQSGLAGPKSRIFGPDLKAPPPLRLGRHAGWLSQDGCLSAVQSRSHQPLVREPEQPLPRISTAQLDVNPPHAHPHLRRYFQELQSHAACGRLRQLCPG